MYYCYNCMKELDKATEICPFCNTNIIKQNMSHQLVEGTLLNNRYLVGRCIGDGGFGVTYIGLDTKLDLKVAIKEYYPKTYAQRHVDNLSEVTITSDKAISIFEKGKIDFYQEAKIIAKLDNVPNIVSVKDVFEENNTAYIVMEYVEGKTLKNLINQKGKLSYEETLILMKPILDSLILVHDNGLLHRDISPDNIIITSTGNPKLIDFGASRLFDDDSAMSVIVKAGYAPIEQYSSKSAKGPWIDVYAVAGTIYKCITGNTPPSSLNRLNGEVLLSPIELGIDIPNHLNETIIKGLALSRDQRYQNVREFMSSLYKKSDDINEDETILLEDYGYREETVLLTEETELLDEVTDLLDEETILLDETDKQGNRNKTYLSNFINKIEKCLDRISNFFVEKKVNKNYIGLAIALISEIIFYFLFMKNIQIYYYAESVSYLFITLFILMLATTVISPSVALFILMVIVVTPFLFFPTSTAAIMIIIALIIWMGTKDDDLQHHYLISVICLTFALFSTMQSIQQSLIFIIALFFVGISMESKSFSKCYFFLLSFLVVFFITYVPKDGSLITEFSNAPFFSMTVKKEVFIGFEALSRYYAETGPNALYLVEPIFNEYSGDTYTIRVYIYLIMILITFVGMLMSKYITQLSISKNCINKIILVSLISSIYVVFIYSILNYFMYEIYDFKTVLFSVGISSFIKAMIIVCPLCLITLKKKENIKK